MFAIVSSNNTANVQIKSRKRFSAYEVIALEILERSLSDVILIRDHKEVENAISISPDSFDYIVQNYLPFLLIKAIGETKGVDEKVQIFVDQIFSNEFTNIIDNLNCKEINPTNQEANKQLSLAKQFVSSYFDAIINKYFQTQDTTVY